MSLGQKLLLISEIDPVVKRWITDVRSRRKRQSKEVSTSPASSTEAASSGPGVVSLVPADVTEVYSPPRATAMTTKTGLTAGSAMDLRKGYDFSKKEDQELAKRQIRKESPKFLVGSPECKMFSILQHVSPWTVETRRGS